MHQPPLLLLLLLLLLSIVASGIFQFSGDFYIRVESVKDIKMKREYIDWTLGMRRISRYENVMIGKMIFKKTVGPISAKMFLEKWGDGGYKKYVVNNMDMGVICKNEILKNFFSRFNMTLPNDCIFQPSAVYLQPTDIHKELHSKMQNAVYGKFRVKLMFFQLDKPVMGYELVVSVEKK